ncbi:M48 family metallopeptidase [Tropicimonas sp. IMCC34011]|uniref:M48 family metallopeptidase n=1 Tax=Tropicimonas sp. IMCC34011 TaxID=2248759 RepID=UPI000E2581EB|nr:M48 family metallopeptidase [Tropicimonas sp. IMCC34011]
MRWIALVLMIPLGACAVPVTTPPTGSGSVSAPSVPTRQVNPDTAARNFVSVVQRVEPVAERECRARAPQLDCDFLIVVDDRPGLPANAFQTLDKDGRPVIGFTLALIADAQNTDELAFVLGHEASHHISGHIARSQASAQAGALILGGLAQVAGSGANSIETAARLGATVGSRRYSKDFELEADRLGTIIAIRAGYDPVKGAEFFTRIPDPGDRFLGSHPPNGERIAIVRQTAAQYR